ncbi:PEP-utilizing enzyme [Vibrio splendidus]
MSISIRFLLCVLLMSSPQAYAFPLADGAGTLSTLAGVIASLLFAIIPSPSKQQKTWMAIIAVGVVVFIGMFSALSFYYLQNEKHQSQLDEVRQSRPEIQLNKDITARETIYGAPLTATLQNFLREDRIKVFRFEEWKNTRSSDNLELVVVNYRETSLSDKAYTVRHYSDRDKVDFMAFATSTDKQLVLYSFDNQYSVSLAKALFEEEGIKVSILPSQGGYARRTVRPEQQVDLGEGIFRVQHLYDLRNDKNIKETHTVYNAEIFTTFDLVFTPHWQLKSVFSDQSPVFTAYYPNYETANFFLEAAGITHHRFIKGGLQHHFLNNKLNLTPDYFNNRVVTPEQVHKWYINHDKIRFLCMSQGNCLDNLPNEQTFVISYKDMTRQEYFNAIAQLPKDAFYVTVSNNQETAGLAIMTGYHLIQTDHSYLGELPAYSRFSLEHVRHYIGRNFTYDTSLTEYQNTHYSMADFAYEMKGWIDEYGYLAIFMLAGCVCRVICFPMQFMIYKSYYREVKLGIVSSLLGLMVPVFIILYYLELSALLSDYAVIPHRQMDTFLNQGATDLKIVFIALVALQSYLSFPTKPLIYGSIIGLVSGVYLLGYMDPITQPMMMFLLTGEVVSICLQLPFYIQALREQRRQQAGYALIPIKQGISRYPDKWLNLTKTASSPGILVSSAINKDTFFEQVVPRLSSASLMVRSASTQDVESALGGYYESYKTDKAYAFESLKTLAALGCDYGFIQPFIEAQRYGTVSSIALNGQGMHCVLGAHTSATEGTRTAQEYIIPRSKPAPLCDELTRIRKTMLKLENTFKSPLLVELALSDTSVVILQVRTQPDSPTTVLFPLTMDDVVLAEDFLVKSTYTNASILQHISAKQYIGINGYLYRCQTFRSKGGLCTAASNRVLGKEVTDAYLSVTASISTNPGYWLHQLKEAVDRYERLYKRSQSHFIGRQETLYPLMRFRVEASVNELDISGEWTVTALEGEQQLLRRAYIHELIVLNNAMLNLILSKIMYCEAVPSNLEVRHLLNGDGAVFVDTYEATQPLTQAATDSVFYPGDFTGALWCAKSKAPPPHAGMVLFGDEIASDWVKDLHLFKAVISLYGHENSHLAISARAMQIPYKKVSQEVFDQYRQQQDA